VVIALVPLATGKAPGNAEAVLGVFAGIFLSKAVQG